MKPRLLKRTDFPIAGKNIAAICGSGNRAPQRDHPVKTIIRISGRRRDIPGPPKRHGADAPGPRTRADLCPALVITEAEVTELFDRFERGLAKTLVWAKAQKQV